MSRLDCSMKNNIICPHCDYNYEESEHDFLEGDFSNREIMFEKCENCGESFTARIFIEVKYTTIKGIEGE